jgi:hypothetical protein
MENAQAFLEPQRAATCCAMFSASAVKIPVAMPTCRYRSCLDECLADMALIEDRDPRF